MVHSKSSLSFSIDFQQILYNLKILGCYIIIFIFYPAIFEITDCTDPSDPQDTVGWVVSSESCSFGGIGARYYREVLPGNIIV